MRTSSSVEPGAVCAHRARLFETIAVPASWQAQETFHAWRDPDRPGLGITMNRPDACTVSVTTVEVFSDSVRMTYHPTAGPHGAHVAELPRAAE
jgi:hypothetical protein